ncbi:ABC transporter ATP-binding protein [Kineosporia babensis]|uniref:ABC transporter ATP-binding protein n=1 Tax=Kineosporia babensis TaxID=499548 RepID=A0A9X1NCG2_9ACTN|nr:ABC transporter ATP-binding protein [Kineosporia babensis]MCD5311221.1 ABC transporter ATP-binding protein [Kineosporia babensis]
MSGSSIALKALRKDFRGTAAVDGIDLEVPAGSFLVLLGPSGCGKTTTLRMLAGLEHPTGGEIRFGERQIAGPGISVNAAQRGVGMVFQSYALWPHMSVQGNVEWPLKIARRPAAERRRRVAEVLDLLDIGELAKRYPAELSGGQQQRVAIARTIAPDPSVLLFDEPLSNLDAKLRVDTRAELLRIHRATGATSVYVTHDQVEAMSMATHVALLRGGRIEQFGPPAELLADPASDFVATFMGTPAANVLNVEVKARRAVFDGHDIGRIDAALDGRRVRAMYRAESLRLAGPEASITATFAESAPLAGRFVITGTLRTRSTQRISVITDAPPALSPGDEFGVLFPERPDRLFSAEDGTVVSTAC